MSAPASGATPPHVKWCDPTSTAASAEREPAVANQPPRAYRVTSPSMPALPYRYGCLEVGNRGGIVVPGTMLRVPLEPA